MKSQKAMPVITYEDSDSENTGLIASHVLSVLSLNEQCIWIMDLMATCHMCHNDKLFSTLHNVADPIDVMLGDRHTLTAIGRGNVVLDMMLPNSEVKPCVLHDVVYVPKLAYNLISVTKASQKGKIIKFTMSACYVLDKRHKMVAKAIKVGSLYQLDHKPNYECVNVAE